MTVKVIGERTRDQVRNTVNTEAGIHLEASKLRCPHILECYGYGFRRAQVPYLGYIYMEYAPFGDLFDLLQKTQKSPA